MKLIKKKFKFQKISNYKKFEILFILPINEYIIN